MDLQEIEIIQVSVSYGETKSLPEYSNVKPSYSLTAKVNPGQDPDAVREALSQEVKRLVWEDCDTALERAGRPAHFYQGPRFDGVRVIDEKYIAIVPSKTELPELWTKNNYVETGWRLEPLVEHLGREWSGYTIRDFSQNPEVLPELAQVQLILTRRADEGDVRYCIALPFSVEADNLGESYRYLPRRYHTIFAAGVAAFVSKYAQDNGALLVDCTDGDLSKLPKLEAPEPEIEPDDDEPIDEDDDDDGGEADEGEE